MGLSKNFLHFLKNSWQVIQKEQTVPKFYYQLPDRQILPAGTISRVFQPHEGYFEIRLAEMFLRDKRVYWEEYIPVGVILSDFIYSGQRQSVPFLVGNQLLKPIEQYLEGQYVQYFNTRIAGPIPYLGDDVGLFVGLFRSPVGNRAETLFSFMETLVGAFDLGQISPYLKIAQQMSDGLGSLLGLAGQGVEYRLGNRDVFVDPALSPGDSKEFRECYLVYVNCPENALDRESLRVKEERLLVEQEGSLAPLRSYDFCLIHLKSLPFRNDYTTFPCYTYWLEAVKRIYEGDTPGAKGKFLEFVQNLSLSPDMTVKHRHDLIATFQANFAQEVEKAQSLRGDRQKRGFSLAAGDAIGGPKAFQKTALAAEQAGTGKKKDVQVLWDVHRNWGRIPHLSERSANFDWRDRRQDEGVNQFINDQLQEVSRIHREPDPDPQALADALTSAYLGITT